MSTRARTRSAAAESREPADEYLPLTLRCPVCATEFTSEVPVCGRVCGRDTDLRPRFDGADPLPTLVHTCPGCRFTAYRDGFQGLYAGEEEDELLVCHLGDRRPARLGLPAEELLGDLRQWLRTGELTRGLSDAEPYGALRYALGARCFEYLCEDDLLGAADYYLRGSWCARLLKEPAAERFCQAEALARWQAALDQGALPEDERVRVLYLSAELSRRLGDFARAVDGFSQLESLVDPESDEGPFFLLLARRQLALAMVKSDINGVIEEDGEA